MAWIPTYSSRETAQDVRAFVRDHKSTFWRTLKPLLPGIVGGELLNVVLALISPTQTTFVGVGTVITTYFLTCLAISWHRVTLEGPNARPMNPYKPRRNELAFIGMGIAVFLGYLLVVFAGIAISAASYHLSGSFMVPVLCAFAMMVCIFAFAYAFLRITIYFPAKAINNDLTLIEAFRLSEGLVLKLIMAPILASWRVVLAYIAYFIASTAILVGFFALTDGMATMTQERIAILLSAIIVLPQLVIFQPLLNVLSISCLSNYYQYAIERVLGKESEYYA